MLAVLTLGGCTGGGGGGPHAVGSAALRASLRSDLDHYLTARRKAEHISAVALRVTFRGGQPAINVTAGTTRYDGGVPVSSSALWQIGSNTKAFTAVMLLQLEAEASYRSPTRSGNGFPSIRPGAASPSSGCST